MKSWIWGSALLFLAACGSAEQKSNRAIAINPKRRLVSMVDKNPKLGSGSKLQLIS